MVYLLKYSNHYNKRNHTMDFLFVYTVVTNNLIGNNIIITYTYTVPLKMN